jgi:hypothetical protein
MLLAHVPYLSAAAVRAIPGRPRYGADVHRTCLRTGCSAAATASLSYEYAARHAWLADLDDQRDPHTYDLCADHADRLVVPRGWTRDDRRSDMRPLFHVSVAPRRRRKVPRGSDEPVAR